MEKLIFSVRKYQKCLRARGETDLEIPDWAKECEGLEIHEDGHVGNTGYQSATSWGVMRRVSADGTPIKRKKPAKAKRPLAVQSVTPTGDIL